MAKDEDEELDFTFPLSSMVRQSLEELKHQNHALTSSSPAIKSYRGRDYEVGDGFSHKPSRLDDDISLLGKSNSKAVVSSKTLEELEKLTRQALLVGSHAEWVLGSVVALMDANDAQSVVRAIESLNIAQRHNASLMSRMLANLTFARREQFLATSSLSSVAKASLYNLPIPLDSKLFDNKIAETVERDAETTSKQALVSLAGRLSSDRVDRAKPNWSMPSFSKKPDFKDKPKSKPSFRKDSKDSKGEKSKNFKKSFQPKK